jgi:hypothetical protein
MRMPNLLLLALSAAAAVAPADNRGPAQQGLLPSSPWNVDYAEAECRLSRTFGAGADSYTLRIIRGANLKGVQYVVAGKSLKIRDWNYSGTLGLRPGERAYKLMVAWYRIPSGESAFQLLADDALKPDEIAPTRGLVMEFDGAEPLAFAVGNLEKPLAALDSCYDDLLTGWGVDPAKIRNLKAAPDPIDLHTWHLYDDAWVGKAAKGKTWMSVRLDVSETGKAVGCQTLSSSGSAEVDTKVCALSVKNARFKPAISTAGDKVIAPFILKIQIREQPSTR